MVTLTIDNRTVTVPEGTTILEAARTARIEIPTMCYLKEINEIGACRLCIVGGGGSGAPDPSCNNVVAEGMVIHTHSPRVREARRVNLRLLLSQHEIRCTKRTRAETAVFSSWPTIIICWGALHQGFAEYPHGFQQPRGTDRERSRCMRASRSAIRCRGCTYGT